MKKNLFSLVSAVAVVFPTYVSAAELPQDDYTAELYEYSCKACHASEQSGAPLSGDIKAWQPRLEKGMEQLLDNTINGVNAMPALGSCSDCEAEDFIAIIKFMAGIESK